MNIAIIPARGGSKRIPKKNIKPFCGKPIIAWSIIAAINSRIFDKIIVSTDSPEIADIAVKYGAEVPFIRPAEFSDDYTGTNEVVKHAIHSLIDLGHNNIEYVCCIYATAPFLKAKYLKIGLEAIKKESVNFAFSVSTFDFPPQRALILKDEVVSTKWKNFIYQRSQDLEELYHDAGQFYWGHKNSFLDEVDMFDSNSSAVIIPRRLTQDIDTFEDWELAESMFNAIRNK